MSVSLATIYANVLKDLGLNSADTTWQSRATRWINKSLDKVQFFIPNAELLQESTETITTTADDPTDALDANFFELLSVRNDTEGSVVEVFPRVEFERRHPDPSSEETGAPVECTIEWNVSTGGHYIRWSPTPDDAYTMYIVQRVYHPALSGAQSLLYNKLETAIEDWAIYEGSLVVFPDNEFVNYRAELKARAIETMKAISQVFNAQKPNERNIPVRMKKYA